MTKLLGITEELHNFIVDNAKGIGNKELTELINKKFNRNFKVQQIKGYKHRYKISSGLTGYFEKGHISFNKGKKWDEYLSKEKQERCRTTTYKKGEMPLNHREIGSERINIYGYTEIKIAEPNKWDLKHRVIYEKKYGKIPEGYCLIFLDGNKQNIELSNLKLVSRHEELIMNEKNLFFDNKEITNTGSLIAKVLAKGYELKNERGK